MRSTLSFKRQVWFFLLLNLVFVNVQAQVWSWMNGSKVGNTSGTYGTLGVGSASNTPGGRYGSVSWTDLSGNLWLFGGRDGSNCYNDLWRYNTSTNVWTWINGSNTPNQSGVYGTMGAGSSTNTPGARAMAVSWVDNSGNLWMFGGEGRDAFSSFGDLNDLWKYNVASNEWTWMKGTNLVTQLGIYGTMGVTTSTTSPGARRLSQCWKDNSGVFWLFGGLGYSNLTGESKLNDMWKFDPVSNNWTWMNGSVSLDATAIFGTQGVGSTTNTPGSRYGSHVWKDNSGNLWMFGGYGFDASGLGFLSDIWRYNPSNNQWTWMDGSSTVNEAKVSLQKGVPNASNTPGGNHVAVSWRDASANFYILGGFNGGHSSEFWKYDIGTGNWTFIKGGNVNGAYGTKGVAAQSNDPGAGYHRANWTDASGNFWVFGGVGYDGGGVNSYLNELWKATPPTLAPTANFAFNQTAQVCSGSRIIVNDLSTNAPTAWSYSLDGVFWSNAQNPILQNPPTVTIAPGNHTVSVICANALGNTTVFTQTIAISSNTVSLLTIPPAGTSTINIGSGATPNSDWSPWVFNFSDPLPPGAKITQVDLEFDGVDQGWGGSGAYLGTYLTNNYLASFQLSHSLTHFSQTIYGPFQNYVSGGNNFFSMYFVGYPGWQSFIYNATMVLHYEAGAVEVCAGNTVTLTATGTATNFVWTNGAINGASHTPTATSVYTVTGNYANGCVNTSTISVIVDPIPVITITGANALCSGSTAVQTATTADPAVNFTWSTGANTNSISVSPTVTTTYSLIGLNATTGCSNTALRTVSVNPLPLISVNSGSICSGNSFTMSASGASTYTYSSGSNIVSPTVNTNYSVTGTSIDGCVSANPAVSSIVVNTTPTVAVNSGSICAGSVFTIVPTGASTYTITGGSATVSPASNTSYSVTGSSLAGCLSAAAAVSTVTVNAIPTLALTGNTAVCVGASISQTVSGATSYVWSSGATTSVVSLSPPATTNYTITGTSAAGCSNTIAQLITVNPLPTVSIGNFNICSGNAVTLTPTGAISYTYSGGSNVVTPLTTTSYSISGSNGFGCVSAVPAVSTISVNTTPTISVNSGIICAGNLFTISPSGASTYTITGGATVVSPTTSASYSVTGTSAAGCMAQNTAVSNLTVNPNPVLTISGAAAVCNGFPITQTVSGANAYNWSTGSTSNIITLSPTVSTTYTVTGTNTVTGCSSVLTRFITVGTLPVITVNSGNICAGSVFTMVPNGATTYTFSNGTNTVSSTVSPSVNTTYYVSGTSSLGCVSTNSAVANVIVNPAPVIGLNSGAVCAGGSYTLVPNGASTYTFLNGSTVVSPGATTTYSVMGTNLLGCVSTVPGVATVSVNPLPVITANNGSVCQGNVFTIVPSGASTYTYSSGSATVSPTSNTNYSISGTSAQGCVSSAPAVITVSVSSPPVISVNSGTVCSGSAYVLNPSGAATYTFSSGSATVNPISNNSYSVTGTSTAGCVSTTPGVANVTVVSLPVVTVNNGTICSGVVFTMNPSGASTYTYSSGSSTVSPLTNTVYSIIGSNAQGCVSSNTAMCYVMVNAGPVLNIAGTNTICSGDNSFLSVGGANSYTWSNNSNAPVINVSPVTTTTYSVSGMNSNGCIGTASVVLTVNPLPTITVNGGAICPNDTFVITPTGALTYTFSSFTNSVSPSVTTSYSVSGTSANGCVSAQAAVVTVSVVNNLTVSVAGPTAVCTGSSATLTVSGANNYNWNTGSTSTSISPVLTGNASFTVIGTSGTCADTAYYTVNVNALPSVSLSSSSKTVCAGQSATLTGSGALSYVWSTTETNPSIVVNPTISTSYTVTGTDANGCSNTVIMLQSVSECVGIENHLTSSINLLIYPNPNTGKFTVESPQQVNIQVFDMVGKRILEQRLDAGKTELDLEAFSKGLYLLKVLNGQHSENYRIIKQ